MKQPRNVSLTLTENQKVELKKLAAASGMTLTKYLETVLGDAVEEAAIYRPARVHEERRSLAVHE